MKKNLMRFFAVIALLGVWTACNEQEGYLQGPDEAMASTITGVASLPVSTGGVTPYIIPGANPGGNRTCEEAATAFGITSFGYTVKQDYPFPSDWPVGLTVTTDGQEVAWTFTAPAGYCLLNMAVIVKGSAAANVYFYDLSLDPKSTFGDLGLESPVNASGNPAGLSNLTFCYNLVECTPEKCYEFKGETAWAANGNTSGSLRYNTKGNWATYVKYEGALKNVTLFAGQTMAAGTVQFSGPVDGKVTITITLNDGWEFADVMENVKIQDYATAPSGNPAPGLFAWKGTATSSPFTIEVPANNFYGVHADVGQWIEVPCLEE